MHSCVHHFTVAAVKGGATFHHVRFYITSYTAGQAYEFHQGINKVLTSFIIKHVIFILYY